MAGRGGRGAALLQALEKPTRPPGQGQNQGQNVQGQPPHQHQNQPPMQYPPGPQNPMPPRPYQSGPQYNNPQQYNPQQGGPGYQQPPPRQSFNQRPPMQHAPPYNQQGLPPQRPPQQGPYHRGPPPQSAQPYQGPQGMRQPYQGPRVPQGQQNQGPENQPTYNQRPQGPPYQGAPQGLPYQGPPQGSPNRGHLQGPPPQGPPHGAQGPHQGPPHGAQGPPHHGQRYGAQGPPRGPTHQSPPHGPHQDPPQQGYPQRSPQQQFPGRDQIPHGARPPGGQDRPSSREAPTDAMSRMSLSEGTRNKGERGTSGKHVALSANYIPIRSPNQGVFQYCVSFSPEVDSKDARIRLVNQHIEFIGKKAFDGITLYLPKKLPQEVTQLQSEHPYDKSPVQVTITLTKVLPPEERVQLYNILFRRIMRILKMQQVGRYYYDPSRPAAIPQHNLELWPGYITAIQHYQGGLMLLCDISHRLLRTDTCLNFMVDMYNKFRDRFEEETTKQLVGTIVLTRYNNKTYRIDDIEWKENPMKTFVSHNGQEMTYVDYYRKAYNIEIKDHKQPLLVHRPKKRENKENRRGGRPSLEIICLIPELCSMTGLTDNIRSDFRVMKDIAAHTRVGPMQRLDAMRKFMQSINSTPEALEILSNWGLELDQNALQTDGRHFQPETIRFLNTSCSAGNEADWGRDATRQQVISAVDLSSWMVVFARKDNAKASDFVKMMKQVTSALGIKVLDPQMIELRDDRTESYLRTISQNLHSGIQMVVVIFPTSRDDRYAAVKKLCCVESPVPSQAINARTISQSNKLRSVTQKIALQINVKLGGTLWGVDIPSKSLMVVGIDVYHDAARGGRSVGGVVCSINQSLTRWYSRVSFQSPGQELIDGLKMALTAALKKYHEINNTLPQRIVVFRDGVGDGQLKVVGGYEVQQLSECFNYFGEAYVPKMTVIVVQKRINTRLFLSEGRGPQSRLTNPGPGTVLDHTVTRKDWYDFFLVSQHVRQGTVTPTHYVVVHDTSNWKPDIIQKLSYKLTHLYYNWPGTVSVPAPCQYAHKLAFQVGQSIHAEPSHVLSDRLFFL